ncbi:hypothetical protein EXIGLDRAFT_354658 [Exidia glandulosa HHB12029]|uniref:Uncharacterized protein n=1 Tax=Exidia glandulosa HHB12029 TaxID=1314781 RepID=A0A165CB67_EXIGL|nr:hypothetical protein EXIGLDRAFT_354658 [Exidia glandulosa HHB12029]
MIFNTATWRLSCPMHTLAIHLGSDNAPRPVVQLPRSTLERIFKLLRGRGSWTDVVRWSVIFVHAFPPRPDDPSLSTIRRPSGRTTASNSCARASIFRMCTAMARSARAAQPCGRANVREWAHAWVCGACSEMYTAPLLGVSARDSSSTARYCPTWSFNCLAQKGPRCSMTAPSPCRMRCRLVRCRLCFVRGDRWREGDPGGKEDLFAHVQGSGILRRISSESEKASSRTDGAQQAVRPSSS